MKEEEIKRELELGVRAFLESDERSKEYKTDFQGIYQDTYTFRGYADYRKFPEIEEKFDRQHLQQQLSEVQQVMNKILGVISKKMDIGYLIDKSTGKVAENTAEEEQTEEQQKEEEKTDDK